MKWNRLYEYPSSTRSLVMGQRHYDIGNDKLPSVTTILSQTQPKEKQGIHPEMEGQSWRE